MFLAHFRASRHTDERYLTRILLPSFCVDYLTSSSLLACSGPSDVSLYELRLLPQPHVRLLKRMEDYGFIHNPSSPIHVKLAQHGQMSLFAFDCLGGRVCVAKVVGLGGAGDAVCTELQQLEYGTSTWL